MSDMITYNVEGHTISIPKYIKNAYEFYVDEDLDEQLERFILIACKGDEIDEVPYKDDNLSMRVVYAILREVAIYESL